MIGHKRAIGGSSPVFAAMLSALVAAGGAASACRAEGAPVASGEAPIYHMPTERVQTRWFTRENPQGLPGQGAKERFGRKGSPSTWIEKGQSLTLVDVKGSGTVRKIWLALGSRRPDEQRGVSIEAYWDDAPTPAVQAPAGDFFCHSLGQLCRFENAMFASPEGRSHVSFVPMPFRKRAVIKLKNETDHALPVYYDVAVTLNEDHPPQMLYFHSTWRRERYLKPRQDMTILPQVSGRGRFLGCNLGLLLSPKMRNFWWGEGEVKMYVDGDGEHPTLVGTGTEDYVLSAWGQERFECMYMGNQYVAPDGGGIGFYRFHIPDPVYFHENLRVDIQMMGGGTAQQLLDAMAGTPGLRIMKPGRGDEYFTEQELKSNPEWVGNAEREGDDYSATAYFYLDRPENGLPPLAPPEERLAGIVPNAR